MQIVSEKEGFDVAGVFSTIDSVTQILESKIKLMQEADVTISVQIKEEKSGHNSEQIKQIVAENHLACHFNKATNRWSITTDTNELTSDKSTV